MILHVDRASNSFSSEAGLILTNLERIIIEYALRFAFQASNNQAEYKELLVKELTRN